MSRMSYQSSYTMIITLLLIIFMKMSSFSITPRNNIIRKTIYNKSSLRTTFEYKLLASNGINSHNNYENMKWISTISTDPDLNIAMDEVLSKVDASIYDTALFFVSSIYEATAYPYDIIFKAISNKAPNMKYIIGCTTGCPIGPLTPFGEPVEVEARASISVLFASLKSTNEEDNIDSNVFHLDADDLKAYTRTELASDLLIKNSIDYKNNDKSGISIVLGTDSCKPYLADFMNKLEKDNNIDSTIGVIASSVTNLHISRLLFSSYESNHEKIEKQISGVIGLVLRGDIEIQTVAARSCLPVGPMFEVVEADKREILNMKLVDPNHENNDFVLSPLVHLDRVLQDLSSDQSYSLKRELLVGLVSNSPQQITGESKESMFGLDDFYGQKPTAFDPMTGSITVPCLPTTITTTTGKNGPTFQFCIRDTPTARQDLQIASETVKEVLNDFQKAENNPFCLLLLGSMDRGNKVFRHQSWESSQIYQVIKDSNNNNKFPLFGMFSSGSFTSKLKNSAQVNSEGETTSAAVMEADSIYGIISKKQNYNNKETKSIKSVSMGYRINDILTETEKNSFNDENDGVIVTKRDPESAHPVKVASMDYFVPEKMPQPKNFLESLVWDREKDVDKMRERFQLARALAQAKASEGKFPKRDIVKAIRDFQDKKKLLSAGGYETPPLMIEILRSSVNNGKLRKYLDNTADGFVQGQFITEFVDEIQNSGLAVSIGCNVDSGTFRGQYEDLEILKAKSNLPVFCNDFVVYAYQLFKAKSSGADSVKLMASVLSAQDITYLLKISKAIGNLMCVVVVSSKVQLLDIIKNVPGLEAISVTSRNMQLWKIDPRKADRILQDEEVKLSIKVKKSENSDFLVFQEGFTSPLELINAKSNGVDAVFLGEELLLNSEKGIKESIQNWIV